MIRQELADRIVTLQEIVRARNQRRRALQGTITERGPCSNLSGRPHEPVHTGPMGTRPLPSLSQPPKPTMKRYRDD